MELFHKKFLANTAWCVLLPFFQEVSATPRPYPTDAVVFPIAL